MKKLIIAADLGRVRVWKVREAGPHPLEQWHLDEIEADRSHDHVRTLLETVTDKAGRFEKGEGIPFRTGMSHGEEHHLLGEMEKRDIARAAGHIEDALGRDGYPEWILAAPPAILRALQQNLSRRAIAMLDRSLAADLTRCTTADMEERFR